MNLKELKAMTNGDQQGDVVLKDGGDIKGTKQNQHYKGKTTLALGEVTGHHHSIDANSATAYGDANDDIVILDMKKQDLMTHQEHNPITINTGIYERYIVREVDHLSGVIDRVRD